MMKKVALTAPPARKKSVLIATVLSMATLLSACGGGGGGGDDDNTPPPSSSDQPANPAPSQPAQTTTSSGSVSGFGSVIVNGVTYDDTDVVVTIDNNGNAAQADLRLGMVVDIQGEVDATGLIGDADNIVARSAVRGPVSAVDPVAGRLTVLGTNVSINAGTVFSGAAGLGGVATGARVEIYGYSDQEGNLNATRIEVEDPAAVSDQVRLAGIVTDATNTSFRINGVPILYNAAAAINFPGGTVANGMRVRASGTLATGTTTPTINATDLRQLSSVLDDREGQRVELEGVVTAFRSTSDFDVNGVPVTVSANADSEGTPAAGAVIEVEGTVTNGVLVATSVEVKDSERFADADLTGPIADIDLGERTFTMRNGRVTVRWDDDTDFDEDSLPNVAASLANGAVLRVDGRIEGNVIVAEDLRALGQSNPGEVEVKGRIANLDRAEQTFALRNGRVTVRWNSETEFDDDSLPGGAANLANAALIEAEGQLQGSTLIATRIEAKGQARP